MTEAPSTHDNFVHIHKLVQASPKQVYDTWLNAASYPKWFVPAPGASCTEAVIDARVGGKFSIAISLRGDTHIGFGEYLELVPGKHIVSTWAWKAEEGQSPSTTMTLDLFETHNPHGEGPATEIVLTHAGLNTAHERSDHTDGWWGTLHAIGYFVRGVDPREAMYGESASSTS